jgi:hypothetical protein
MFSGLLVSSEYPFLHSYGMLDSYISFSSLVCVSELHNAECDLKAAWILNSFPISYMFSDVQMYVNITVSSVFDDCLNSVSWGSVYEL